MKCLPNPHNCNLFKIRKNGKESLAPSNTVKRLCYSSAIQHNLKT